MITTENKELDFFHLCPVEILVLSHSVNENLVNNFNRFDSVAFEVKNLTNLPLGKMSICFPSYVLSSSLLLTGRGRVSKFCFISSLYYPGLQWYSLSPVYYCSS